MILAAVTPTREKLEWERLGDVQVPRGILWVVLFGLLYRQRVTGKAIDEFGERGAELAELLGSNWREGIERERRLVELQGSVETLTRRLVGLTIVLGVIGLAGIAATIWAASQ